MTTFPYLKHSGTTNPSGGFSKAFPLDKSTIKIGRHVQNADFVIDSTLKPKMISRIHAIISRTSKPTPNENCTCDVCTYDWIIEDNKSLNGVYVNNIRVRRQTLQIHDLIIFGGDNSVAMGEFFAQPSSEFVFSFTPPETHNPSKNKRLHSLYQGIMKDLHSRGSKRHRHEIETVNSSPPPPAKESLPANSNDSPLARKRHALLHPITAQLQELRESLHAAEIPPGIPSQDTTEALEEEFCCTICQDLFVQPQTFPCGHSFCQGCIEKWLTMAKKCPICRETLDSKGVTSIALANAVSIYAKTNLSLEALQVYQDRVDHVVPPKGTEAQIVRLRARLEQAKARGYKFLKATTPWTLKDCEQFQSNIKNYHKEARMLYCSAVGLTPEVIRNATPKEKGILIENLKLNPKLLQSATQFQETLLRFLSQDLQ